MSRKFTFKAKTIRLPWDERCREYFQLSDDCLDPETYSVRINQDTALFTCKVRVGSASGWLMTYQVRSKNHFNLSTWVPQ